MTAKLDMTAKDAFEATWLVLAAGAPSCPPGSERTEWWSAGNVTHIGGPGAVVAPASWVVRHPSDFEDVTT